MYKDTHASDPNVCAHRQMHAHEEVLTLDHPHLTMAISIVCVDTYEIDFPWQHGPSIATNIGLLIMLTQNTITSACLHCSCGTIIKKKKTRTRGCPEGCSTSSPRFNVNLISSLALRCLLSAQQTPGKQGSEKQKGSSVIKGFCHPERTHSSVCINRDRGRGRDTTTLPEGMALKA